MLKTIDKSAKKIEQLLVAFSLLALLFITFLTVTDVFLRYCFEKPLPATWEMSEVGTPWIVFFAFAYALTTGAHVRVSLIIRRLPFQAQWLCEIFANILCFIICTMFTYWSFVRFWESFIVREEILAAIRIPWWVGKFAMPIGMGMLAVRYLIRLFLNFRH